MRFEYGDGSSFGGLTSKNDWPIFCELSGMGLEQGKTLFRVVAEVDCRVRILSMESMYSVLFRGGKGGEEMEKRAVSFFETLLRHYASTLHSLLTLDSTYPSSSSNPPLYSGRGECCSSVFDEAVVFTWKCSFLRKGGEEGLVCLTASYLALIRDPSRKTKTIGLLFLFFSFSLYFYLLSNFLCLYVFVLYTTPPKRTFHFLLVVFIIPHLVLSQKKERFFFLFPVFPFWFSGFSALSPFLFFAFLFFCSEKKSIFLGENKQTSI